MQLYIINRRQEIFLPFLFLNRNIKQVNGKDRIKDSMPPKLAILIDNKDNHPPSNKEAIDKFKKYAFEIGMDTEIIYPDDFEKLKNCDALFIRCTTSIDNFTIRMADYMERNNKPVIDTVKSIKNGSNKLYVFQEALKHNISIPKTKLILKKEDFDFLEFPFVVKPVYGCCSQGLFLAESYNDIHTIKEFPLIAQEYIYTEYDWRVGILNNKVLYTSKYYMVEGDWRIATYNGEIKNDEGDDESIELKNVPEIVKQMSLDIVKNSYGEGFFGVDIKEKNGKYYLMEVNDNVSIEGGVEDKLNDDIYKEIVKYFKDKIDEKARN